jgi:hypothetical protein
MGALQLMMAGGSGALPSLDASYGPSSTAANAASFLLLSTGVLRTIVDGVTTDLTMQWLTNNPNSSAASLYSVRRTQVSGTVGVTFTGTMTSGTWFSLSGTDRGVSVVSTLGVQRQNTSTWDLALTADTATVLATTSVQVLSDP